MQPRRARNVSESRQYPKRFSSSGEYRKKESGGVNAEENGELLQKQKWRGLAFEPNLAAKNV
jgi:hypothetical protein